MKFQNFSVALMLAAGLAIGCEEAKDAATDVKETAQDAAATTADKTGDAVESLKTEAVEAGEAMKEAGTEALDAGKEKMDEAVEAGKDKVNELAGQVEGATKSSSDGAASGISLEDLKGGMSLDSAQLDGVIDKVKGFIGEKNYDTAQQWVTQLQGMELPEGYADQIEGLKGLLEKAQGAGDMLKGIGG